MDARSVIAFLLVGALLTSPVEAEVHTDTRHQAPDEACVLGQRFAALRAVMPDVVGDCLSGAWADPAGG